MGGSRLARSCTAPASPCPGARARQGGRRILRRLTVQQLARGGRGPDNRLCADHVGAPVAVPPETKLQGAGTHSPLDPGRKYADPQDCREAVRLGRQRSRCWRPSQRLRRRTGIQHPAPHRRQDDRSRTRRPGRRHPAVCHGQQGSDEVRVLHRPGSGGDQRTGESDARSRNVRLDTPRAVQAPSHTVSLILLHGHVVGALDVGVQVPSPPR
jgi:hypothetical protein